MLTGLARDEATDLLKRADGHVKAAIVMHKRNVALDEARHRLFVGCRQPAKLLVIDTTSGKQTASLEIGADTDDITSKR